MPNYFTERKQLWETLKAHALAYSFYKPGWNDVVAGRINSINDLVRIPPVQPPIVSPPTEPRRLPERGDSYFTIKSQEFQTLKPIAKRLGVKLTWSDVKGETLTYLQFINRLKQEPVPPKRVTTQIQLPTQISRPSNIVQPSIPKIEKEKIRKTQMKKRIKELKTKKKQPKIATQIEHEEKKEIIKMANSNKLKTASYQNGKLYSPHVGMKTETIYLGDITYELTKIDAINNFARFRITFTTNNRTPTTRDIFDTATDLKNKLKTIPMITLHFVNQFNKVRSIIINQNYMDSFEEFEKRIDEIQRGDVVGSDAINENEYELVIDTFDATFISAIRGFGKLCSMIYETVGIDSKKQLCGYLCLKHICDELNAELKIDNKEKIKFSSVSTLSEKIKELKLPIDIISNNFVFQNDFTTLAESKEKKWVKIGKKNIKMFNLLQEDIKNVYLYSSEIPATYCIIHSEKNEHYDVIKNYSNLQLNNICCDNASNIYKKTTKMKKEIEHETYEKIYSTTELFKENKSMGCIDQKYCKPILTRYLIFDYETVLDWETKSIMRPYSLSFLDVNDFQMSELNKIDEQYNKIVSEYEKQLLSSNYKKEEIEKLIDKYEIENKELDKIIAKRDAFIYKHAHFYLSFDCTKTLLEYITKRQENKYYALVNFNGVNFDNFILMNDILNLQPEIISDIFYNGKQLLSFKISGRHTLFDIRKHLTGSLSKCCDDYKIRMNKKLKFDHTFAQKLYDENKLMEYYSCDQNKRNQLMYEIIQKEEILKEENDEVSKEILEYKSSGGKEPYPPYLQKLIDTYDEHEYQLNKIKQKHVNLGSELEKYNNRDVSSLAILYYRYEETLKILKLCNHEKRLYSYKTIGSMVWIFGNEEWKQIMERGKSVVLNTKTNKKIIVKGFRPETATDEYLIKQLNWESSFKIPRFKLPTKGFKLGKLGSTIKDIIEIGKKNEEFNERAFVYYKDILKYKSAGRVELFNGIQKINERQASIDICSAYPYASCVNKVFYPCGDIIEVEKYENMPTDLIGFFYCDIDQSNLRKNNLPNISCEKNGIDNDWGSTNLLKKYFLSTIKIEHLRKYGCKVKTYNGIYFTHKIESYKLFGFLLPFMQGKNEQDNFKKNNPELYNHCLRETLKLLMNAPSGKLIEKIHTTIIQDINSFDYEKMQNDPKIKSINCINIVGGKVFAQYTKDEFSMFGKHRPVYWSVLIYDYTQRYMYDNVFAQIGLKDLIYTDTDSCKVKYSAFLKWKQWAETQTVPHWEEVEKFDERYKYHKLYMEKSKVFGSFEDEYEETLNVGYYLQKKTYIAGSFDENKKQMTKIKNGEKEEIKYHLSFKGISKNDIPLTLKESFLKVKINKNGNKIIKIIDNKLAYDFYNDKEKQRINNAPLQFFEELYKNKIGYVLCQNMRTSLNNTKRNVKLDESDRMNKYMNCIELGFVVKKIEIQMPKISYYEPIMETYSNIGGCS